MPVIDPTRRLASTSFLTVFEADPELGARFTTALNKVLIGTGILPPDVTGIALRDGEVKTVQALQQREVLIQSVGKNGETLKTPLQALANGYQQTIGWVADLIGHILNTGATDPSDFAGLVLVDEIDAHLHPRWQRELIGALRETFPKLQFIVTTHSPALLSAFRPEEIVRLGFDDEGSVVQVASVHDPRLATASEIFEDYFSVDDATLNPHGALLREATAIRNRREQSADDRQRLATLIAQLKAAHVDVSALEAPRARSTPPHLAKLRALAKKKKADAP